MLLRHLLEDLNGMSKKRAMFVLNDICIDKSGDDKWNFAINIRGNVENNSILFLQGRFVTDTFIHKNYDVNFNVMRQNNPMYQRAKVNYVTLAPFQFMVPLNLN